MGFPSHSHTRWHIAFLKEGACLLNPPTGRRKHRSLYMNVSKLPDVSFPLLILLCTREHHWFWVQRTSSDFPNMRVILGLPTQSTETRADKNTQRAKQKIAKRTPQRRRGKTANRSLLDCLETWSATLGFCMIFSQMSGSFSSLSFHPMVPPGVKRQQFSVQRDCFIH